MQLFLNFVLEAQFIQLRYILDTPLIEKTFPFDNLIKLSERAQKPHCRIHDLMLVTFTSCWLPMFISALLRNLNLRLYHMNEE